MLIPLEDKSINLLNKIVNKKVNISFQNQSYGMVHFGFNIEFLKNARDILFTQSISIAFGEISLTILLLLTSGYYLTKNLNILTEAANKITANWNNENTSISKAIAWKKDCYFDDDTKSVLWWNLRSTHRIASTVIEYNPIIQVIPPKIIRIY